MHVLEKSKKPPYAEFIQNGMYSYFVLKAGKAKVLNKSKSRALESKDLIKSKPNIPESKVLNSSKPKAKKNSRPKTFKPKVLNDSKPHILKPKVLKKEKSFRANPKEPMKICVPKSEILYATETLYGRTNASVMVPGQWLLMTHDKRKAHFPNINTERGKNCAILRKP